ncbi:MAG: MATE family efflux transporter, partial [Lachnospiraceae bacterium]|nr:MATE family efflux transporter [Lachnospiraceae bacterium]
MVIAFIIFQTLPGQLLGLFAASDEMLAIGIPALRTISFSFLLAGVSVICSSFFQAMGDSVYSMVISIMRQLVCLLPLAYLFAQTGDVTKVWLSWPIAEVVSLLCGLYFLNRVNKKKIKPMRQ